MSDKTPAVTIVISPRERFGEAKASLDNVIKETPKPYELVYVSGTSPAPLLRHIDEMASRHGFKHVKRDRYLSPNEARNIGIAHASGDHIVFLDHDVFCAPGWLAPLVECAQETGAEIVAPLTCHGSPVHEMVHQAGGEFAPDPETFFRQPFGEREIVEVMHHQNRKAAEIPMERQATQLCEYHAVLVKRSVFEKHGPLDEGMLSTKEHLDLCMTVIQSGGTVMFEPKSIVTYFFPSRKSPITTADWPFFLIRWSPTWQKRSYDHFQAKWGLKSEGYLEHREGMLDWRHYEGVIKPTLRKIPFLGERWRFQMLGRRIFGPVVDRISRRLAAREDRKRSRQNFDERASDRLAPS